MNDEDTHNTPSHTLSLTERQIDTIIAALKFDFKKTPSSSVRSRSASSCRKTSKMPTVRSRLKSATDHERPREGILAGQGQPLQTAIHE